MSLALIAHITLASDASWLFHVFRFLGIAPRLASNLADDLARPVDLALVIITGILVSKIGSKIINHSFKIKTRLGQSQDIRKTKRATTLSHASRNVFKTIVWIIVIISVFKIFGINVIPVIAGATVIGAVIGFSAQNLIKDYLSGFLLILEDQIAIGDKVIILDVTGIVKSVSLRTTEIVDDNGTTWFIANGDVRKLGSFERPIDFEDD